MYTTVLGFATNLLEGNRILVLICGLKYNSAEIRTYVEVSPFIHDNYITIFLQTCIYNNCTNYKNYMTKQLTMHDYHMID